MPSRVLIQRCLNADGVSAEAAKRIKQLLERCVAEPDNERSRSSLHRVLLATGRPIVARAPAGWGPSDSESDEGGGGGGGGEVGTYEAARLAPGDIGQCAKDPLCTRGYKHCGKGGRCSHAPRQATFLPRLNRRWRGSEIAPAAGSAAVVGDSEPGLPKRQAVAAGTDVAGPATSASGFSGGKITEAPASGESADGASEPGGGSGGSSSEGSGEEGSSDESSSESEDDDDRELVEESPQEEAPALLDGGDSEQMNPRRRNSAQVECE
mmetsp:Transcript_32822/g.103177  ORF Transcript_32822/g.103177 Transcript_32822/m.103177 type:complete len:267 (-) Transcript_32822:210-1010(-)